MNFSRRNIYYIFALSLIIVLLLAFQFNSYFIDSNIYAIVYICCAILGFRGYYKNGNFDIFSPGYALICVFFMYSFASGVFTQNFGVDCGGTQILPNTLTAYYYLCLIAECTFFVGLLLYRPYNMSDSPLKTDINPVKLIAFALLFSIPHFERFIKKFDFINAVSYGENALVSRLIFREDLKRGLADIIFVEGPIFLILVASIIFFFNKSYSLFSRVFMLTPFICYLLYCVISGIRGAAVNALFIPIFYYHYEIKQFIVSRRNMPYIILTALVFFVFMRVIELVRHTSNPAEMVEYFSEQYSSKGNELFDPENVGELMVGTNQINLIQQLEDDRFSYNYGATIFSELAVFIPRAFYPNRPLPVSELYVYTFYRHIWEKGGGFGLFITMEGYWAFGIFGVVLFCLFYGGFIQSNYCKIVARKSIYWIFVYCNFFLYMALYAPRSGMVGNVKAFLMSILGLFIFKQISKIRY